MVKIVSFMVSFVSATFTKILASNMRTLQVRFAVILFQMPNNVIKNI